MSRRNRTKLTPTRGSLGPEHPAVRLRRGGAESLTDAELVALLAPPRGDHSATGSARAWLERAGGVRGLLDAELEVLAREPGVGPVAAARLQACRELVVRYLGQSLPHGPTLHAPDATRRYLRLRLSGRRREVFACLFLDAHRRVLGYEELFHGTIDSACVHPREVVRRCLAVNAAAVIVAHNHPSGVAEPSAADRAISERLGQALALIDVRLIDHVVVSHRHSVSLAERGWL